MKKEITYGNRNEFKIRYVPNLEQNESKFQMAHIHLILDNELIGDPNESCMVETWISKVEQLLNRLIYNNIKMFHEEFDGKTDMEIFKLICKSNQLEEEYEKEYQYLPVLPNEIWTNCNIIIDETIDAYQIVMICFKDTVKFIWKGWREPCSTSQIGKLKSTEVKKEYVITTLSECLTNIKTNL